MSAAIAGVVIGVGSAVMSFAQASKQKKLQARAEADADAAMEAARGRLEVNFAEEMSIKKEGYELESEANLAAGAQALEAGVESERGGAATAGRILASQQAGQAGVRTAMGDELTNIEGAILEEDSRLRDLNVSLDLEEVAGNQQKAAEAQAASEAAKQAGIQSTVSAVGGAVSLGGAYSQKTSNTKAAVGGMTELSPTAKADFNASGGASYLSPSQAGALSNRQFRQYSKSMSPTQKQATFGTEEFANQFDLQQQYGFGRR